jgi:dCMP deaminase
MRPTTNEYFMEIAKVVATRSTCLRHHVGAVIVKDKHIISTGYNGAPRGLPHCTDVGCIRDLQHIPSGTQVQICVAVHAEQNAIIQAALHGISTKGGTLYCTLQPCIICSKMIINAGIVKVIYFGSYPDDGGLDLLREAGIDVGKYEL